MTPSSSLDGLFKYRRFDLAANTRRFSGAGRRALSSGLQSKILGKMPLTKAELAAMLFEKIGLNKREAKDVVESFYEEIRLALETGESVKLAGFGNFERNPKTGS